MVEAVKNINVTPKKDNTNRNTGIMAAVGTVTGYLSGAKTKKIYKNGEFTDEFIKQLGNTIIDSSDESNKLHIKIVKEAIELGENPDINKVKGMIKPIYEQHHTFNYKSDSKSGAVLYAQKAERAIKRKAGAIWGVASGIVFGFGTYVLSKVLNNKEV